MKIIKTIAFKNKLRVTVEIPIGFTLVSHDTDETLVAINPNAHYKLGEPMHEEVFAGHILADAIPTHWCSLEQKWIS